METILKKIKRKIYNYLNFDNRLRAVERLIVRESDAQKLLLGKGLTDVLLKKGLLANIQEAEFSVFSDCDDDGILQYLVSQIDPPKTFVDIGGGTYTQPDTRFLLQHNKWSGLAIDGSPVNALKESELYSRYDLTTKQAFVTTENINDLIDFEEIGLFNVDIDGNDYWVWKALKKNPVIVMIEYNGFFGLRPITIPYDKDFDRRKSGYGTTYCGTSLASLYDLAIEKGYAFVGCNSSGINAFFVRKDKLGGLKTLTLEEGYVKTKIKGHRDKNGDLSFLSYEEAIETLRDAPVFNTRENKLETI